MCVQAFAFHVIAYSMANTRSGGVSRYIDFHDGYHAQQLAHDLSRYTLVVYLSKYTLVVDPTIYPDTRCWLTYPATRWWLTQRSIQIHVGG